TTSSFDRVHRISKNSEVTTFFRGLSRPQGLAFDKDANLYIAASYSGRHRIVHISPQDRAELMLSSSQIVKITLLQTGRAMIATINALFTIDWDMCSLPMLG